MKKIIHLVFVLFFNSSYACSLDLSAKTKPLRLIKGEWVESKTTDIKSPVINYKKLIGNYSIVFSGTVELAYTEDKEISDYIYTDEIWKGNVLKSFDINSYNTNIKVIDGYCGHRLIDGLKYIFFAEIGTRKNPIRIFKVVHDNAEVRKLLKEPVKRWHKGQIVKY